MQDFMCLLYNFTCALAQEYRVHPLKLYLVARWGQVMLKFMQFKKPNMTEWEDAGVAMTSQNARDANEWYRSK